MVWQWIRNRQIFGQKFRREFPIPPYAPDFCCVELRLVIEIDGECHFTEEGRAHDRVRDRFVGRCGYRILRIAGYDVVPDDGKVIQSIREFVQAAMAAGENVSSSH
jgi:very-short-patch-repair endonuclease